MSRFEVFKEKLAAGEYGSVAGAKRAIGKFHGVTDAEREQARALADKHFAVAEASVPKKAAAPKRVAPPKDEAHKEVTPATGYGPGKGRVPRATKATSKVTSKTSAPSALQDLGQFMSTVEKLIDSVKKAKDVDASVETSQVLTLVMRGLEAATHSAMQISGVALPEAPATFSSTSPVLQEAPNGVMAGMPGFSHPGAG